MIPAVSAPRQDGRSSFEALQRYLTLERQPGTRNLVERGPFVLSNNLLSLETAATEMRAVASQNRLVTRPLLHFQFAWKPGEKPTQAQWQTSAERAIQALGFKQHQYVIVAHDDKKHFHVHITLNRVDPETLKAHNPRLSLLTLHKVARELEHEFGWTETPGLFRWDSSRKEAVRTSKRELEAIRSNSSTTRGSASALAAKQDHFRDEPSLKAFASKQPAERLRKVLSTDATWTTVHLTLAQHGLTLNRAEKGGYTVGVENSEIRVKASDVFRFAFSGRDARARLEAQLGPYQPARLGPAFTAPVIDHDNAVVSKRTSVYYKPAKPHYALRGSSTQPRSIADLPTLSTLPSIDDNALHFDRIEVRQAFRSEGETRPIVHVVVRPGNLAGSARVQDQGATRVGPSSTPEERRQDWRRQQAEAGQQRRRQRTEERNRDRQELKREYLLVRESSGAELHQHVLSARARRTELEATMQRDKAAIRQLDAPWPLKRLFLAQAAREFLQAKLWLATELRRERSLIVRPAYAEWIELRARASDQRAVAQMRGWRYQDQRNLRKIERSSTKGTGELAPDETGTVEKHSKVDWQELANGRLRELREQAAFREAASKLMWKADTRTGDAVYTLAGVAALIDQGQKIVVLAPDRDATRLALQMAIHKYGGLIDAKGTAEWQTQLIRAAVQDKVQVVFTDPELQRRLVSARQLEAIRQDAVQQLENGLGR